MSNKLPNELRPLFNDRHSKNFTLCTSTNTQPSSWLLARIVALKLTVDSHRDIATRPTQGPATGDHTPLEENKVILVSFLRPFSAWLEHGRKTGVDLTALIAAKRLIYVDQLHPPPPDDSHQPTPNGVSAIEQSIQTAMASYRPSTTSRKPSPLLTLIIDGIDFHLATQPALTASDLAATLLTFQASTQHLVVSLSADGPLLHRASTTLEQRHRTLVTMLAHQSDAVVQLRGLSTGTAKDVSGVLRVSGGGQCERERVGGTEGVGVVVDCEWLYHVKDDGTVRLWSRGQG